MARKKSSKNPVNKMMKEATANPLKGMMKETSKGMKPPKPKLPKKK